VGTVRSRGSVDRVMDALNRDETHRNNGLMSAMALSVYSAGSTLESTEKAQETPSEW